MRVLMTLALLLGFAAPARAADPSIENGSAQAALNSAKAKFAGSGLEDYGYTISVSCFCATSSGNPYTLHVRAGAAVGAPEAIDGYETVLRLFERVQGAIDQGADSLKVTYASNGAPTSAAIDFMAYASDDELGWTVTNLRAEDPTIPQGVDDEIEDGSARDELGQAKRIWAQSHVKSYRWKVRHQCFCPPKLTRRYTITVRKGKTKGVPKPIKPYRTVSLLFKIIDNAIAKRYSGLDVKYAANGRPLSIGLDPNDLTTDDEQTITTSKFKALG